MTLDNHDLVIRSISSAHDFFLCCMVFAFFFINQSIFRVVPYSSGFYLDQTLFKFTCFALKKRPARFCSQQEGLRHKHKLKYSQSILAFISAFKLSKQAHKRHRFPILPLIRLIFHFSKGLIFNFMKTLRRLNCTNWYIAKNDTCKLLIQNSS